MKLWQIVKRSLVTCKGLIKYKDKFKNYEQ